MKKKFHLKRNEEIAKVVSKGKTYKNECYIVHFVKNINNTNSRICISVSKKLGIAVIRNLIKRQVRSMVREIFDYKINIDYVIIVRNRFLAHDFNYNKEQLLKIYDEINKGV